MRGFLSPRSLQARLLSWVLLAVLLVWLAGAAWVWWDAEHEIDELLDSHLAQAADLLLQHQRVLEREADREDEELEAEMREHPPVHKYSTRVAHQVFRGQVLVWRSAHVGNQPLTAQVQGFATVQDADGGEWRVFSLQARDTELRVIVAEQTHLRHDILWAVLGNVLKPMALALPMLMLGLWWAVQRGLSPLRTLVEAVRQRRPLATQPLEVAGQNAEIDALVQALNEMFARVAQMLESERRFTADAAHELRTPIAVIRTHTQVAMLGQGAEREQALRATLAGCDRASHLVDQLLMLARLEAVGQAATQSVDLSQLVQQVAADLGHLTLEKQQDMQLDATPAQWVRAQPALLTVLVRNLLDNAIRYSPAQARILVQVDLDESGRARLRVQDSGPGLTREETVRLGQRFFRVLGQDQPGSGLGWSIVRRIALVQGAQIQVGPSAALGGLDVQVFWPSGTQSPL